MIHMRNVRKVYDTGVVALDGVNVDIKKGEFVFVVGASGAGKSTFIKMLFREELPTSGELLVNGHDVVNMERSEVPYLRRGLGVIFQDYRLLPDKTVFENVAFAMQVIEAPRRTMQRSVNAVLDNFSETIRAENISKDNAITLQVGTKANQSIRVGLTDEEIEDIRKRWWSEP